MNKLGITDIRKHRSCYIIAEAGVNHNGDINLALELVKQAKMAGADCVKFQTFKAEQVVTESAPKARYQLKVTDARQSQYEMLKSLELGREQYIELINYCEELDIDFLSTPYNHEDVDFLEQLGVMGYKIASGQLVELSFLRYVALKGKILFVSTGMAEMSEVAEAIETIRSTGNNQLVVLQCTTNYPSNIEDANINAIQTIKQTFQVSTGYSDHVANNYACYAAVALGAEVIEKHFTLDRNMPGPDHSCSLDPNGFTELVKAIRQTELSLGNGLKQPCGAEIENMKGMRRSIAAKRAINKGEVLSMENIGFKRPASGLRPQMSDIIIGMKAKQDIKKDTLIQLDMINWK